MWGGGRVRYAAHIIGLLRPGHPGPVFEADTNTVGPLDAWPDADIDLLLEEGRRTADAQRAQLDATRSRALTAQAITLALLTVYASQLGSVLHCQPCFLRWVFFLGGAAATWGLLGLLSVTMTQVAIAVIHPGLVSRFDGDRKRTLAAEYAGAAADNNSVLATLLTVFREAVLWVTLSAAIEAGVWIALKVAHP